MPVKIQTSALTALQAAHLLRRSTFGASPDQIKDFTGLKPDVAVERLLGTYIEPSPPVDPTTGQTFHDKPHSIEKNASYRSYTRAWWAGLMLNPQRALHEKMTLFWQNHFVATQEDVNEERYMYRYNNLLRKHALGSFNTLAFEMTKEPAMLRYLDGNTNTVTKPNENFARELQELFTIGRGNYTEEDVKSAARVLTGWSDVGFRDLATGVIATKFDIKKHDSTDKVFSSLYGNKIIKGRTENDASTGLTAGDMELKDLLDMILGRVETARFICRKLYRWFIYSEITASVEKNFIIPLADLMIASKYEIRPVIKTLLMSTEFYNINHIGAIIKSPMEFLGGFIKGFGLNLPKESSIEDYYSALTAIIRISRDLQQDLMGQPNVFGWPAYYNTGYYQLWLNSVTLYKRNAITDGLATSGTNIGTTKLELDVVDIARVTSKPSDPKRLVDDLTQKLFAVALTTAQKDFIIDQVLLPNKLPRMEWTEAWDDLALDFTNAKNRKIVNTMLENLFKYLLRMAEYQLS
jgi:uncharacterized protein (DUF1800 family)